MKQRRDFQIHISVSDLCWRQPRKVFWLRCPCGDSSPFLSWCGSLFYSGTLSYSRINVQRPDFPILLRKWTFCDSLVSWITHHVPAMCQKGSKDKPFHGKCISRALHLLSCQQISENWWVDQSKSFFVLFLLCWVLAAPAQTTGHVSCWGYTVAGPGPALAAWCTKVCLQGSAPQLT